MFSALGDLVMGHRHLHMWLQGLRASCFTSECLHALPSSGTTDRGMSSVYWAVSAVRTLTTKAASITVSALHYDKHSKVLQVAFSDGSSTRFSAELLRSLSPSADAGHKAVSGRRHVGIMNLEPVGNYAVRLHFDDLHSSGIFTWEYLHHLQHHRLSAAKAFLRRLQEQGGSRDPPKRTPNRSWPTSTSQAVPRQRD